VIDPQSGLGKCDRHVFHPDVLELGDALCDVDAQAAHRGGEIKTGGHGWSDERAVWGDETSASQADAASMVGEGVGSPQDRLVCRLEYEAKTWSTVQKLGVRCFHRFPMRSETAFDSHARASAQHDLP
jgi:hypothetical protein